MTFESKQISLRGNQLGNLGLKTWAMVGGGSISLYSASQGN